MASSRPPRLMTPVLPVETIFRLPGFLNADTGPTNNAEFHVKARQTRMGSKFEWPDISKNVTVTGQIEADFEGNFSRADNRNVSTIRSNALSVAPGFRANRLDRRSQHRHLLRSRTGLDDLRLERDDEPVRDDVLRRLLGQHLRTRSADASRLRGKAGRLA